MSRYGRTRPGLSYLWYLTRTVVLKVLGLAVFLVIAPTVAITAMLVMFWVTLVVSIIGSGVVKKDIY